MLSAPKFQPLYAHNLGPLGRPELGSGAAALLAEGLLRGCPAPAILGSAPPPPADAAVLGFPRPAIRAWLPSLSALGHCTGFCL